MKKMLVVLHIWLMSLLYRLENFWVKRKMRIKQGDLERLRKLMGSLSTPRKVADWLLVSIKYKEDGALDFPQEPIVTFFRKTGDCEDYALFAANCLLLHEYETKIVNLYWQENGAFAGHSICAFKQKKRGKEKWAYIDTAGLYEFALNAHTLEDMIQFAFGDYKGLVYAIRNPDWSLERIG